MGDALGAPVEFRSTAQIRARFGDAGVRDFVEVSFGAITGTGLVTDDTQMTLFTIEGLIRASTRFSYRGIAHVPSVVNRAYTRWYATQTGEDSSDKDGDGWLVRQEWLHSRRAPGNTCLGSLQEQHIHGLYNPASNDSQGCGAVMRSAPFGWTTAEESRIFDIAVECAAFTHGHPNAQQPAGAFALLIAKLMRGLALEEAVVETISDLKARVGDGEVVEILTQSHVAALNGHPNVEALECLGQGWVGHEALAIAIYAALAYPERGQMLDALSLAVSHGGDSDSTGAICGNLLGALHGESAVPAHLAYRVEGRATMLELADDYLYELRDSFTPNDALPIIIRDGEPVKMEAKSRHIHDTDEWILRYPGY